MKVPKIIRTYYTNLAADQKKIITVLIAILSCLLIYFVLHGCYVLLFGSSKLPPQPLMIRHGDEIEIPAGSPLRAQMQIKSVTAVSQPHVLSFPGFIEADPVRTVNILPPLSGRLMSLNVTLGQHVHENQVLAEISSPDLAQAYSDNDIAVSAMKLKDDVLQRAKEVHQVGGNSVQDVQQAENDFRQAQAEANRAEARLKTLGKNNFNVLTIRSPIEGRVTAIYYGMGSYITDPTMILMTVVNIDKVWVTANVPEHLVGMVNKNQTVNIYLPAYPQQVFEGKVSFVNSFLEPDTRSTKTRIQLLNPRRKLKPNMFAMVNINIPQPDQVMIPLSSILMSNESTSVYVETKPWTCQRREVELGMEDGDQVRVLSGLKAGERIVTCGGVFIND